MITRDNAIMVGEWVMSQHERGAALAGGESAPIDSSLMKGATDREAAGRIPAQNGKMQGKKTRGAHVDNGSTMQWSPAKLIGQKRVLEDEDEVEDASEES